eukprot:COSAG04_NODE_131_length_24280_cov_40.563418_9_plen_216_part_00
MRTLFVTPSSKGSRDSAVAWAVAISAESVSTSSGVKSARRCTNPNVLKWASCCGLRLSMAVSRPSVGGRGGVGWGGRSRGWKLSTRGRCWQGFRRDGGASGRRASAARNAGQKTASPAPLASRAGRASAVSTRNRERREAALASDQLGRGPGGESWAGLCAGAAFCPQRTTGRSHHRPFRRPGQHRQPPPRHPTPPPPHPTARCRCERRRCCCCC